MDDESEFDAWYSGPGGGDHIRVRIGRMGDHKVELLDIRDAVYFRYLLDGAIQDYERAVGK